MLRLGMLLHPLGVVRELGLRDDAVAVAVGTREGACWRWKLANSRRSTRPSRLASAAMKLTFPARAHRRRVRADEEPGASGSRRASAALLAREEEPCRSSWRADSTRAIPEGSEHCVHGMWHLLGSIFPEEVLVVGVQRRRELVVDAGDVGVRDDHVLVLRLGEDELEVDAVAAPSGTWLRIWHFSSRAWWSPRPWQTTKPTVG